MFTAAERIAETIAELQSRLKSAEQLKDLQTVQAFFDDERLIQALSVHNSVTEWSLISKSRPADACAVHNNSRALVAEVLHQLPPHSKRADVNEIKQLLQSVDFTVRHTRSRRDRNMKPITIMYRVQALMTAHDGAARQSAASQRSRVQPARTATKPDTDGNFLIERVLQYGEDSIKIVRLQKTSEPLVRQQSRQSSLLLVIVYTTVA